MRYIVFLCLFFLLLTGCSCYPIRPDSSYHGQTDSDISDLETFAEILTGLATANAVSAPVNPLATPIGIGLTGLIAMLEALRRKEKSGRKHAESKLNTLNGSVVSGDNVQSKT